MNKWRIITYSEEGRVIHNVVIEAETELEARAKFITEHNFEEWTSLVAKRL